MKTVTIKNAGFSESDLRLDASYHLSDGPLTMLKLKVSPYALTTLTSECERIFSGNIFKRSFVKNSQYGWPYLTGSDMVNVDINNGKYLSKRYTTQAENLRIHKEWILISCSGTLGNCVFTNEDFEGKVATHDLIRAIPNENNILKGYLYAYLSSKYGYGLLTQASYGGVVKHIEPHHIANISIPILPKNQQEEINHLILQASDLRVAANKLLQEAILLFEESISESDVHLGYQVGKISSASFNLFYKRLDSQYQLLWQTLDKEKNHSVEYEPIIKYAKSIFVGGRGKRNYVKKGIPFLSSSEMMLYNPKRGCKMVSKFTPGIDSMIVSKKEILISRSGTVGNVVLVGEDLSNTAISEHALRLVIDENKISPNYVFCFLKTKYGLKSMEASSFGSVIITLNEDLIGNIKIPIVSDNLQSIINEKIELYIKKLDESVCNENKAIDLVEQEIESWQK